MHGLQTLRVWTTWHASPEQARPEWKVKSLVATPVYGAGESCSPSYFMAECFVAAVSCVAWRYILYIYLSLI